MNTELLEALNVLEKEKSISKDTLLEAIEQSLIQACKNHFGKADNIKVNIDPQTCEFGVFGRENSSRRSIGPGIGNQPGRCKENELSV